MDLREKAKFFSVVSVHKDGQELSNELQINMTKALKEYRNMHGTLPQRILFFRDGVGDGQMHYVISHEVDQLRNTLNKHYEIANQELKFAFIIVNKKINTRIFKAAGNANPVTGTVVDDVITLPERYDFYLVSQSVRQGTVAPTLYNVVYDSFGLPPGKLSINLYDLKHFNKKKKFCDSR